MPKVYRHSNLLAEIATFLITQKCRSENRHPTTDGAAMEVTDNILGHKYILEFQPIKPKEEPLMFSTALAAMKGWPNKNQEGGIDHG